ncbi:MAG: hypothetical protein RIT45_1766 [Pseudomonadota bacterium]|jgi:Holliday junction resolvase-like predicted endonuclease
MSRPRATDPTDTLAPHTRTGRRGEDRVATLLQSRGATLLARNLRLPAGEADILVRTPDGIGLLVEVKATSGPYALLPRIDGRKRNRLFALAEEAADAYDLDRIEVHIATVALHPNHERITLHQLDPW